MNSQGEDARNWLDLRRVAFRTRVMRLLRRSAWLQRGITGFGAIAGPVLLGIGSGWDGSLFAAAGSGLTWKGIVLFAGGVLALIGGVLLLILQETTLDLIIDAEALEVEARRYLEERDVQILLDRNRLAMIDADSAMRETLEQVLQEPAAKVEPALQLMLDAAKLHLAASVGFQPGEAWTISVFRIRSRGGPARLYRIAALRAETLDERRVARDWGQNEGFVGTAWAGNRDVVIEDSLDARVKEDYPIPAGHAREYDERRYRSMAVIPVRAAGDRVWGVVAASSDQVRRFHRDRGNRAKQAVDTVRLVAQVTALTAIAFSRSKR